MGKRSISSSQLVVLTKELPASNETFNIAIFSHILGAWFSKCTSEYL